MTNTRKLRDFVKDAVRWLNDVALYEKLLLRKTANAREHPTPSKLSKEDHEIMAKLSKYKEEPRPRSFAEVFAVPEWAKMRRRPICEPFINDKFTREETPTVRFRTAEERRQLIAEKLRTTPDCVAKCYDFASYYDQLRLHPEVSRFFCTRSGGKTWSAQTIPMGFRPSCAVAQAITWAIVDFDCDVLVLTYIDNILFLGAPADVEKASTIFEQRCAQAGAILSEATGPMTSFDFLGEHFNIKTNTRCLTTKTLEKLQAVESFLNDYDGTASRREMAATFGLAIFASNVLGQSLGDVYWPMRYLRGLHADDGSWDSTAPAIDDDTLRGLRRWIATLVAPTG